MTGRSDFRGPRLAATLDAAMAQHIEAALARTQGRVEGSGGAAQRLGINPHALLGGIGLLAGILQFHRALRRRLPLHRLVGRIYVIACLITGAAGLYMAAYSFGS